ncbi:hypothetical protein [Aestuariivivens insulae]|uniref:hypothetical protein n=1 Tax=Aestuariivivens insulae TaxID=1621988 RepID=UPI001F5AC60D|nr:hypothetical protein [Aestuariivivens insulae]
MKKIIFILILTIVGGATQLVAQSYTFDNKKDLKPWRHASCVTPRITDGSLMLTMDGTDINPNIRISRINADEAKYVHITLKNNTNAVNELRFNFTDPSDDTKNIKINVPITNGDDSFKTYTIHAGSKAEWKGEVTPNFRFTDRETKITGTIEIHEIVFDANP